VLTSHSLMRCQQHRNGRANSHVYTPDASIPHNLDRSLPRQFRNVPADDVPLACVRIRWRSGNRRGQIIMVLLFAAIIVVLLLPALLMALAQFLAELEG
jgi:hypothetical protein